MVRSTLVPRRRLSTYAYRFRESLFFLPAVMVVGFIALAQTLLWIDRTYPDALTDLPISFRMSPDAAQTFLSVLAGATITVVATVFSLTVVSLQLASAQFSPRVLRTFIRDRLSQQVIGFLVGTFSFSVLVLRDVRTDGDQPYSPGLSTGVTVFLAVAAVVLIVAHLDHLARSLQVGEVLRRIADETKDVAMAEILAGQGLRPAADAQVARLRAAQSTAQLVTARTDGWVRQASSSALLDALPPGASLLLQTRVGAFVTTGQRIGLLQLRSTDDSSTDDSSTDHSSTDDAQAARDAAATVEAEIDIGRTRTMQEDVDFGLRQMTDIALRALSPAINDPTTAIEVVLRLGSVLNVLLAAGLAPTAVVDGQDRTLVRDWELDREEYIDHAFDQIRLACTGHPAVCLAVLRTLRMLTAVTADKGHDSLEPALRRQAELLLRQVDEAPGLTDADRARVRAASSAATDNPHHGYYATTEALPPKAVGPGTS